MRRRREYVGWARYRLLRAGSARVEQPIGGRHRPTSVMIHNPVMAAQVNRLSAFLMTDIDLPEKFKRLAAIIAARSIDCQCLERPRRLGPPDWS